MIEVHIRDLDSVNAVETTMPDSAVDAALDHESNREPMLVTIAAVRMVAWRDALGVPT